MSRHCYIIGRTKKERETEINLLAVISTHKGKFARTRIYARSLSYDLAQFGSCPPDKWNVTRLPQPQNEKKKSIDDSCSVGATV